MKKILIVDDELNVLSVLRAELSQKGVEVIVTSFIDEAEWAVTNTFFDAVILDVRLRDDQGRDGLDLANLIQEKTPASKVILITGFGTPELESAAYDSGAFYFCEKPINFGLLKSKLTQAGIFTLES